MKQNYLETAEVNNLNFLKGFIWILGAISYHLYNFKNVTNTHGGALLLVKMQDEACNFTLY